MIMKKALLRWEDLGPGGFYESNNVLIKLKVIGDYLKSENVPFQVSLIPRFVNPASNYDKSIEQITDPIVVAFNNTMKYLEDNCNASLGMHGYTHQYDESESANGFEFYYSSCTSNCPPNDPPDACQNRMQFVMSYAYSRMLKGYTAYENSGLTLNWGFSTPHYTATGVQRSILEASSGIFFEPDPDDTSSRKLVIKDKEDNPFYRGVIYVPTPLGYVSGSSPEESVQRILTELQQYSDDDLAAFFYHPYLELSFIQIDGEGNVSYDDNSYLKQLIRGFKQQGFTFVPLISLTDFIPSSRAINLFSGEGNIVLSGNVKNNVKTQFINWQPNKGYWYFANVNVTKFPNRQNVVQNADVILALSNWAVGRGWRPFVGDFNGDGQYDVTVWNLLDGSWQVAMRSNFDLIPNIGPGDYKWLKGWATGSSWVPLIGDFNGDGKDDIVVWKPSTGEWQVALSTGSQFIPSAGPGDYKWLKGWAIGSSWVPVVGDFNGDGKDDIAVWSPIYGDWQVALSNGIQFIPSAGPGNYVWLKDWVKGTGCKPLAADFNGDGKCDIMVVDTIQGLWQTALNTDNQFVPTGKIFGPWSGGSDMQPFVANLIGYGRPGILARHPNIYNGTVDGAFNSIS